MANGTDFDLKKILTVIDDIVIPEHLYFEAPEITPPQNKYDVIGGNNAGGFAFQANNSVDATFVLKLFNRGDEDDKLEQKYESGTTISFYHKDENNGKIYAEPTTKILNVSSYSVGRGDAVVEFTIALPKYLRQ